MVCADLADRPRLGQSEMDFSGWLGSSQTCHSWFGLKKAPARLALLRNPWPGPQNHDYPCFPRFPLICFTNHVNSHFLESFAKLNSIEPEWEINLLSQGRARWRTVRNPSCSDIRSYNILAVRTLFCDLEAKTKKLRGQTGVCKNPHKVYTKTFFFA